MTIQKRFKPLAEKLGPIFHLQEVFFSEVVAWNLIQVFCLSGDYSFFHNFSKAIVNSFEEFLLFGFYKSKLLFPLHQRSLTKLFLYGLR